MAIACPDPRLLVRLGTPDVGDVTAERYDEHVESCPACQDVLRKFVDDGLVSSVGVDSKITAADDLPRIPGFTIERELGRGATGVVYQARQDEVGRRVALKLVPGGHAAGERERRRWLREAKAASRVRHPHVVPLFGFGEVAPWSYLVLEFIPGGTLKSRLNGPLRPRDAARLVEMVARAVHKIHQDGFYHLDLKPSNILLEGDESTPWDEVIPKVSDFSIARATDDATASLSAVGPLGTPGYMAPEQTGSASESIGPRADVYALGAILYELLTGRPPIQRVSIVKTLEAIRDHEPIALRRLNPAVSGDLETICLKCLRKLPRQRYETPKALADDLRRYLQGRPIAARRVSPVEKLWRWCRRNPMVSALSAVLILTAICAVAGLLMLLQRTRVLLDDTERGRQDAENHRQVAVEALRDALRVADGFDGDTATPRVESSIATLSGLRNWQKRLMQARPEDRLAAGQLIDIDVPLAFRLMKLDRFEDARPILEECVATIGVSSTDGRLDDDARYKAAWCYSQLAGTCSERSRLDEALSHGLNACAMFEPDDARVLKEGRLSHAVDCHLGVGVLYSRLGRTVEARRWLEDHKYWLDAQSAYESVQPWNALLHFLWLNAAGSKEEARSYLRTAVRSHPKDLDLAKALANELVAAATGGPPKEEDLAFLRTTARSHPVDVELANWLAQRLIAAADFAPNDAKRRELWTEARDALASATKSAEAAASSRPSRIAGIVNFAVVNQQLCFCLVQLGRREEAIFAFRRMVSVQKTLAPMQPNDPGATDWYWREVSKTVLMMRPLLDDQPPAPAEDFLRAQLSEMQYRPPSEGHLGWLAVGAEADLVVRMRRLGQVDDAKRLVAAMSRYAQDLVNRHSRDAYAQLALYYAQIHVFKNAERYKSGNSQAALMQALDAAQRALAISPGNAKAQAAVADCRRRLERIKAGS